MHTSTLNSLKDIPPISVYKSKVVSDKELCWRRKYQERGQAEALVSVTGFSHSLRLLCVAWMHLAFTRFWNWDNIARELLY